MSRLAEILQKTSASTQVVFLVELLVRQSGLVKSQCCQFCMEQHV